MFEVRKFNIVNADGKRNVKVANAIRSQMFDEVKRVLESAGFEVSKAASGELAIKTAIDENDGSVYFTRLAVSFTNKPLEHKVERAKKQKVEDEVEIPKLFDE